jgi:hypothetical protein
MHIKNIEYAIKTFVQRNDLLCQCSLKMCVLISEISRQLGEENSIEHEDRNVT